jgi:putative endonuclease
MVCYILFSTTLDRFYTGISRDSPARLRKHNDHEYGMSHFTASANDWVLYLEIECSCEKSARKIEAHIKNMKSAVYIRNLKKYPEMIVRLKEKYDNGLPR